MLNPEASIFNSHLLYVNEDFSFLISLVSIAILSRLATYPGVTQVNEST